MKIICRCCGRDINAIGQDNMSVNNSPLCEDCYRNMDNNCYRNMDNNSESVKPIFDENIGRWCPNDCSLCGDFCIYNTNEEVEE